MISEEEVPSVSCDHFVEAEPVIFPCSPILHLGVSLGEPEDPEKGNSLSVPPLGMAPYF